MAEQVSKSKRPEGQSCVAGAPNNKSYTNNGKQHTEGISLHGFPKDPTVNGKKKPTKQWVDFVRRHRKEWQPAKPIHDEPVRDCSKVSATMK